MNDYNDWTFDIFLLFKSVGKKLIMDTKENYNICIRLSQEHRQVIASKLISGVTHETT
jgi:hypothetical protein